MYLVGFIIIIYHDARSPERQNNIINISTLFLGLIRPSSGQHSEIWCTISAQHVLWDPTVHDMH